MFPEQLQKILKLIKKTGDRVIVFDPSSPDDSYVILDLNRYSSMVDNNSEIIPVREIITEIAKVDVNKKAKEEAKEIEKIKEDIEIKISAPELKKESILVEADTTNFVKDSVKSEKLTEDDLTDKINREISMWKNRDDSSFLGEENKPKKVWQIPSQVKNNAQNIE